MIGIGHRREWMGEKWSVLDQWEGGESVNGASG